MQKWEYQTIEYESKIHDLQSFLNQQGEQGWELAGFLTPGSITTAHQSMLEALTSTPASLQLVFKRQHG
jgi:hypothetical protein